VKRHPHPFFAVMVAALVAGTSPGQGDPLPTGNGVEGAGEFHVTVFPREGGEEPFSGRLRFVGFEDRTLPRIEPAPGRWAYFFERRGVQTDVGETGRPVRNMQVQEERYSDSPHLVFRRLASVGPGFLHLLDPLDWVASCSLFETIAKDAVPLGAELEIEDGPGGTRFLRWTSPPVPVASDAGDGSFRSDMALHNQREIAWNNGFPVLSRTNSIFRPEGYVMPVAEVQAEGPFPGFDGLPRRMDATIQRGGGREEAKHVYAKLSVTVTEARELAPTAWESLREEFRRGLVPRKDPLPAPPGRAQFRSGAGKPAPAARRISGWGLDRCGYRPADEAEGTNESNLMLHHAENAAEGSSSAGWLASTSFTARS
jgi:hypothetical protein